MLNNYKNRLNGLLVLTLAVLAMSHNAYAASKNAPKDSWFVNRLADKGKFILQSKENFIWGTSPIYDDEGKVHVYFSFWPKDGHWLTNSKIGHAIADHPEGPYEIQELVLEGREGKWDANSIHNPSIYKVDGKYMLLYIGNDLSKQETWRKKAPAANTQRVGMAIADSPYGPWQRFDAPVIDVSDNAKDWDSYCTVNPAFVKHPNGEYWIYYRAWDRLNDDRRKTGVAMSKTLLGEYKKYKNNPVIDFPERGGQTEDPYLFHYKNEFHSLIRDMGNYDWLSGLYLNSNDGLHWGEYQRGYHQGSNYLPVDDKKRFERVQLLFKNGEPEYMFNAVEISATETAASVVKINP